MLNGLVLLVGFFFLMSRVDAMLDSRGRLGFRVLGFIASHGCARRLINPILHHYELRKYTVN